MFQFEDREEIQLVLLATTDDLAELLAGAGTIAVLSGAGLSKASGIPTYRDPDGLWNEEQTRRFASIETRQSDPDGFREFWRARRAEVARAAPNAGHLALARLQQLKPDTTLITQNIDGLLTTAGAKDVLEIQGSLHRNRCLACGDAHPADDSLRCPACGAAENQLRPDVTFFGEMLDSATLAKAGWMSKTAQVFLAVGTSALVDPAAGLAEKAKIRGARLVVLNNMPTGLDRKADMVLRGAAETLLPAVVERLAE